MKAAASESGWRSTHIPVLRYEHCNFTSGKVLAGFSLLVLQASGQPLDPAAAHQGLPDADARSIYLHLSEAYRALPDHITKQKAE